MKTIDNVPYFLVPKSTVHSSTTTKFSTRIRLNLVGFQTFARRARVHTAKLNFVWEDPVTVRVLTATGSSEARARVRTRWCFLTVTGFSDKAVTAHILLKLLQWGRPQPAFDINNRFWCHDGNQVTEPMGVITGYINNFHTSKYS